ncbi:CD59A glycoprotein-like [Mus pahari]|uniref:CD59A glycoprotein-like n=1 Tax=Mus pahari TaxID=10093 RepID=UPI000A311366|nr:CD59A glycoprotein-like [Mus pahari]
MRAQRGLILLLLLLAVFCSTAVSLRCYHCLDPVSSCKINSTCSPNQDTCLYAVFGMQVYRQCWKRSECNGESIMNLLEVTKVTYRCCQFNLCNKNNGSLGKSALLGTSVLVAILNLCFLSHL